MNASENANEDHRARSDFVRHLVQQAGHSDAASSSIETKPQRLIIQYWDDLSRLPRDVRECVETWSKLEAQGFQRVLFDERQARAFIGQRLGPRCERAFDRCYHPAMQADYFRLCYVFVEGGIYVDADDICNASNVEFLLKDGRLMLQPLCYDVSTDEMVPPSVFTMTGAYSSSWIFYFNNNPLIAGRGHPIVWRALTNATLALEQYVTGELPEIQCTTGPGNLTKSIFDASSTHRQVEGWLLVLRNWEDLATSKWPLSYRNDSRNWRLSNRRE